MLGIMTVLMFTVATVHFVSIDETTFNEFLADQVPSYSSAGTSSQVRSVVTEVINVCYHPVSRSYGDSVTTVFYG